MEEERKETKEEKVIENQKESHIEKKEPLKKEKEKKVLHKKETPKKATSKNTTQKRVVTKEPVKKKKETQTEIISHITSDLPIHLL